MSWPCVSGARKATVQATVSNFIKAWELKRLEDDSSAGFQACRMVTCNGFLIDGHSAAHPSGLACYDLPYSIVRLDIEGQSRYALRVCESETAWLESHKGAYGQVEMVQLLDLDEAGDGYKISNHFKCLKFISHQSANSGNDGQAMALHEYDIAKKTDLKAFDCFEVNLPNRGKCSVIAMEPVAGCGLIPVVNRLVSEQESALYQFKDFKDFSDVAIVALENLHKRHIAHLDINSRNSLYNSRDRELTFVDYGGSVDLTSTKRSGLCFSPDCGPLFQLTLHFDREKAPGVNVETADERAKRYQRFDLESFGRMLFILAERLNDGLHQRYFQMLLLQHFILTEQPSIDKFKRGLMKFEELMIGFEEVFIEHHSVQYGRGNRSYNNSIRLKTLTSYNKYFNQYFHESAKINMTYKMVASDYAVSIWKNTGAKGEGYSALHKAKLATVDELNTHMDQTIAKMALSMLENYSNPWLNFFCFHWFRSGANIALVRGFLAGYEDPDLQSIIKVINEWTTSTSADDAPTYSITQHGSLWRRCDYIKHVSTMHEKTMIAAAAA